MFKTCNKESASWVTHVDLAFDWWIKLFYCKTARQLTCGEM